MIDATPQVRSMKPCCLMSRVRSSCERILLGRSSGQPCEAWSSCECSHRPNLLTSTTTLMVSWMGAGAASRGIQGACERDQMQQVFSIDRRKWSYMGATNPWLLQPSMDCSQGGCRRLPSRRKVRKTEDQLGLVPSTKSKIEDGSAMGTSVTLGAAVADFRKRLRFEP